MCAIFWWTPDTKGLTNIQQLKIEVFGSLIKNGKFQIRRNDLY